MYILFWEEMSGAIAPQAMFEEMGIDYEKTVVDMAAGEHHSPEYLAVNPTGQVPALKLPDGKVIGESAAMVLVLGERHPDAQLVPLPGDSDRSKFLYWLLFLATSGYMTFGRYNHPERHTKDQSAIEPVRLAAEEQVERFFTVLEGVVAGEPYFLARGFTALDIYLTMLTAWHSDKDGLFRRNPRLATLCITVENRPAYQRVMQDHLR
ncbi:glutathione S-transferase family protein [Pseudomonadota bacterium]